MTKPHTSARNRILAFVRDYGPILAILGLATGLRLDGIGFGLPALNDPDEPLFMMLSFGMLDRGSLDPQWFGHPGTITLYSLALVMVGVAGAGIAGGQFAGIEDFAQAVYLDPGLVILPSRWFIAANGIACVWLTYLIGRRLWGRDSGLAAALFLAVNAIHVSWSQVIRTDVQASVCMLACLLATIDYFHEGGRRALILAGIFAGLACATKWPAAIVLASPLAVAAWRWRCARGGWRDMILLSLAAGLALLAVSPFLLISYDTVLSDLAGEARGSHPGATGSGLAGNLAAYLAGPLALSFGRIGLALALAGVLAASIRSRGHRLVVLPVLAAFMLLIALQSLWWERWLVPVLPLFALSLGWLLRHAMRSLRRHHAGASGCAVTALALVLALPMMIESRVRAAERAQDTRQAASQWIRRHAAPGATVLVEHAAIDLLQGPWPVKFPLGAAGCIDARAVLAGRISASEVDERREASAVVDLGHVDPAMMDSCAADFYVLSNFQRYEAERSEFPGAYAQYLAIVRANPIVAKFAPVPGCQGGPTVLIVAARGSAPTD